MRLALLLLLATLLATPAQAAAIGDYRPVSMVGRLADGSLRVALRAFSDASGAELLVVDPTNLATAVIPATALTPLPTSEAGRQLVATPYVQALTRHTAAPFPLQNDGARHADRQVTGVCLTVDLCPSQRPFSYELFRRLEELPQSAGGPVPVAIAITGRWLENHPREFAWLVGEENAGRLAITWVNHSWQHPYQPGLPLAETFLLTPGTDLDQEVLRVEQALLERGQLPSVYFRFPGLVSSQAQVERLRTLGLLPLGSDAWLAKGEAPRPGSFILVHGNGNEPQGIRRFLELVPVDTPLRFLPLATAFNASSR